MEKFKIYEHEIYRILVRAKEIYVSARERKIYENFKGTEFSGMCRCISDALKEIKGVWIVEDYELGVIIPEFNRGFLGATLNQGRRTFWWPTEDWETRIQAFDKLIDVYRKPMVKIVEKAKEYFIYGIPQRDSGERIKPEGICYPMSEVLKNLEIPGKIEDVFPEFNKKFLGGNSESKDWWWDKKDRRSRIEALNKLISYFKGEELESKEEKLKIVQEAITEFKEHRRLSKGPRPIGMQDCFARALEKNLDIKIPRLTKKAVEQYIPEFKSRTGYFYFCHEDIPDVMGEFGEMMKEIDEGQWKWEILLGAVKNLNASVKDGTYRYKTIFSYLLKSIRDFGNEKYEYLGYLGLSLVFPEIDDPISLGAEIDPSFPGPKTSYVWWDFKNIRAREKALYILLSKYCPRREKKKILELAKEYYISGVVPRYLDKKINYIGICQCIIQAIQNYTGLEHTSPVAEDIKSWFPEFGKEFLGGDSNKESTCFWWLTSNRKARIEALDKLIDGYSVIEDDIREALKRAEYFSKKYKAADRVDCQDILDFLNRGLHGWKGMKLQKEVWKILMPEINPVFLESSFLGVKCYNPEGVFPSVYFQPWEIDKRIKGIGKLRKAYEEK